MLPPSKVNSLASAKYVEPGMRRVFSPVLAG
jgi:hypothetical protein